MTKRESNCRAAYLKYIQEPPEFFDYHKHVEIVTVLPSTPNSIRIPERFTRCAKKKGCTFLYIFIENASSESKIDRIGGIHISTLEKHATLVGVGRPLNAFGGSSSLNNESAWELFKPAFQKDAYYDKDAHKTEIADYPLKVNIKSRIQDSSLQIGDNTNFEDILESEICIGGLNVGELLLRRYTMIRSISDNSSQRKRVRSQQYLFNYQYIISDAFFEGIKFNRQRENLAPELDDKRDIWGEEYTIWEEKKKAQIERLSYKIMHKYLISISKVGSYERKWIATQEAELLKFHLENQFLTEKDIAEIVNRDAALLCLHVEKNISETTLKECTALFLDQFAFSDLPTVWFSADAVECLELDLESLSGSRTVVKNGKCFLSYKHLQSDYIPKSLKRSILQVPQHISKAAPGRVESINNNSVEEVEKNEEILFNTGSAILLEIKGRAGPADNFSAGNLIDIETCSKMPGILPLCMHNLNNILLEKDHLHIHDRFALSGFLMDCGYSAEQVLEYLRAHFLVNGQPDSKFDTKYASIVKRKGTPAMHGYGCEKLISGKEIGRNSDNKLGCPFSLFEESILGESLIHSGIAKNTRVYNEIIQIAKREKNAPGACAKYFEGHHGNLPQHGKFKYTDWRPKVPQDYLKEALNLQTDILDKRRKVEIEFEV